MNLYLDKRSISNVVDPAPKWNASVYKETVTPLRPTWTKVLTDPEIALAHWTVMTNCDEADKQYKSFTKAYYETFGKNTTLHHRMDIFYYNFKSIVSYFFN